MADYYANPRRLARSEIEQAESLGHDCSALRKALESVPKEDTPKAAARAPHA